MPSQAHKQVGSGVQPRTPDATRSDVERMFRLWCEERGAGGENKKTEGNILVEHGRYREAENVYLAAIEQTEQIGSLNPRLADSLNELGMLYAKQHKYARAEQMFQRALGVMVAALGPDHPDVAIILKNMGILKATKKEYAEADLLLSRSLSLTNRVLGHEHPIVAGTMRTIAVFQTIQGHYGEAERFIRRSLEISEKTLGSEHPEVAASRKVFAQVLRTEHRDTEVHRAESRTQDM